MRHKSKPEENIQEIVLAILYAYRNSIVAYKTFSFGGIGQVNERAVWSRKLKYSL